MAENKNVRVGKLILRPAFAALAGLTVWFFGWMVAGSTTKYILPLRRLKKIEKIVSEKKYEEALRQLDLFRSETPEAAIAEQIDRSREEICYRWILETRPGDQEKALDLFKDFHTRYPESKYLTSLAPLMKETLFDYPKNRFKSLGLEALLSLVDYSRVEQDYDLSQPGQIDEVFGGFRKYLADVKNKLDEQGGELFIRRSFESYTRENLNLIRTALLRYRKDTGAAPVELTALLLEKDPEGRPYLEVLPQVQLGIAEHPASNEVKTGKNASDTGCWRYSSAQAAVVIDCTHKDSRGETISSW